MWKKVAKVWFDAMSWKKNSNRWLNCFNIMMFCKRFGAQSHKDYPEWRFLWGCTLTCHAVKVWWSGTLYIGNLKFDYSCFIEGQDRWIEVCRDVVILLLTLDWARYSSKLEIGFCSPSLDFWVPFPITCCIALFFCIVSIGPCFALYEWALFMVCL